MSGNIDREQLRKMVYGIMEEIYHEEETRKNMKPPVRVDTANNRIENPQVNTDKNNIRGGRRRKRNTRKKRKQLRRRRNNFTKRW